jgi:hypothetical protein
VARPATARVTPLDEGGIEIAMTVPTYAGEATFILAAERDGGGDWIVCIPWSTLMESEQMTVPDHAAVGREYLFINGTAYLGAPDETVGDDDEEEDHHG